MIEKVAHITAFTVLLILAVTLVYVVIDTAEMFSLWFIILALMGG